MTCSLLLLEPLVGCDFQLVVHALHARDARRQRADRRLLTLALHGATERDHTLHGDDLDVLGRHRERVVLDHALTDLLGDAEINLAIALVARRERRLLISLVLL